MLAGQGFFEFDDCAQADVEMSGFGLLQGFLLGCAEGFHGHCLEAGFEDFARVIGPQGLFQFISVGKFGRGVDVEQFVFAAQKRSLLPITGNHFDFDQLVRSLDDGLQGAVFAGAHGFAKERLLHGEKSAVLRGPIDNAGHFFAWRRGFDLQAIVDYAAGDNHWFLAHWHFAFEA